MNQPSRLSETQRAERYWLLRQVTSRREPPVITEAGLRLMRDLAVSAELPAAVDEHLRPELERLAGAGVFGDDGSMRIDAEEFLGIMRGSNAQVQIEVAVGQSVRVWKSWVGYERAILLGQPSPAITADDTAHDIAGRHPPILDEYVLQVAAPGWVPVDALHWLGFAPRAHPGTPLRLPSQALLRRLTDPHTPPPHDDPGISRIWDRPMQMCTVTAEPTSYYAHLLDTGETGVWMLNTEGAGDDGTAVLTPLTPRAVWRLLIALTASRNTRQPDSWFVTGHASEGYE